MKTVAVLKQAQVALLAVGNSAASEKCRALVEREEAKINPRTLYGGSHADFASKITVGECHPTPSALTDELALAASGEIMGVMYGAMPPGGSVQLQASVQCIVQRAIEAGNQRQPLDVEPTVARIMDLAEVMSKADLACSHAEEEGSDSEYEAANIAAGDATRALRKAIETAITLSS